MAVTVKCDRATGGTTIIRRRGNVLRRDPHPHAVRDLSERSETIARASAGVAGVKTIMLSPFPPSTEKAEYSSVSGPATGVPKAR